MRAAKVHIKGRGGLLVFIRRYGAIGMQMDISEVARRPAAASAHLARYFPPIIAGYRPASTNGGVMCYSAVSVSLLLLELNHFQKH